jgi:hypothetical protein
MTRSWLPPPPGQDYGLTPAPALDCLVVVLDERDLVIVSARADAEPLLALAYSRLDTMKLPAARF